MTCKNPECNEKIVYKKSAKRRYCNDSCKNRANYLRRQKTYGHLFEWDKLMQHNYHILLKLKQKINFLYWIPIFPLRSALSLR